MSVYRLKGTAGAVTNQAFQLAGTLLIGRADDCDVRIDDERVSAHHAELRLGSDGQVQLKDLGSGSGVRVNGKKVSHADLAGGDEIHIGNCRLMLQAPGLRPERVLEGDAIRPPRQHWPWLLAVALGAACALAWQNGFLSVLY